MRNSLLAAAIVALVPMAASAGWEVPDMSLLASPEFAGKVETYAGKTMRRDTSESLGMVYAQKSGKDCNEALANGLRSMLDQAKALGGERLVHVQARRRFNWSGELLCKGREIYLRGVVMPAKVPSPKAK